MEKVLIFSMIVLFYVVWNYKSPFAPFTAKLSDHKIFSQLFQQNQKKNKNKNSPTNDEN